MGRNRTNELGLNKADYQGRPSTLCKGCGHNSISAQIVQVAYDQNLDQNKLIKMSGIGCSSKSPAYFLGRSHGFNALHGRMPSVTTGAVMMNHHLKPIGVSGDGDTGNIGMGQFKHMVRRNVPMIYIIENNGVYGLTKGQFSATADMGQRTKYAGLNEYPAIDLCMEAIVADATFVARSFSGDKHQVQKVMTAALNHNGTAVIDIISPCVAFNNHDESTKSYFWGKEHNEAVNEIVGIQGLIQIQEEIDVEYEEGQVQDVQLHDGSWIRLKKLDADHDPTDRISALRVLEEARQDQHFVTGLIYINDERGSLPEVKNVTDTPIAELGEADIRPGKDALDAALAELTF
jgi:2-oxoglutarate ferredoxin oxidoreductase subunit beta